MLIAVGRDVISSQHSTPDGVRRHLDSALLNQVILESPPTVAAMHLNVHFSSPNLQLPNLDGNSNVVAVQGFHSPPEHANTSRAGNAYLCIVVQTCQLAQTSAASSQSCSSNFTLSKMPTLATSF